MLNDYKGEKPNNVITEEEHKKRPFYKKVSFWVLSVLGLFFGGCSVYGLVLGYQYVHAVTEAAHIIADAQESVSSDDVLRKNKAFAVNDYDSVCFAELGDLQWTRSNNSHCFFTDIDQLPAGLSSTSIAEFVVDGYKNVGYRYPDSIYDSMDMVASIQSYSKRFFIIDKYALVDQNMTGAQFKAYVNGKRLYYRPDSSYAGRSAYETIYDEGHQDGYQEGYDDGYQALAGVQNVRILFEENFPTLNPINYSWKVDGNDVASGQIMLRPNLSAPVVNLTRPGGYTHKATLNIWSENDEPLVIAYGRHEGLVIGGTQTYIYDTYNKSNAYDWANSVWYVPTYNPNTGFVIYSYATAQQGYSNDYFFEFDPEHNDRAKTGIYADGYKQGFDDGTTSGTAYDNGHADGYAEGYEDGKTIGIAQGESQAVGGQKALVTMFVTAFQQPFDQIYRFLNFNVLGLNILALFTALLTLSIGIIIIKKVI